jgi:hypothetical protein
MIAIARPSAEAATAAATQMESSHARYLELLPAIRRHARVAFRELNPEAREEAIAEALAYSWVAFRRLVELGRVNLAFAAPLAQFAVARVRDGRRVGCRANVRDVSSPWCQRRKRIDVESLDQRDTDHGWKEIVVEDKRSGPARIAGFRIDFAAWIDSLPQRQREIAEALAAGHDTRLVAGMFNVSPGRISQLRKVLHAAWCRFQGQTNPTEVPTAACG